MKTDKSLLRSRFAANFRNYDSLATVQNEICAQLAEMLGRICTVSPQGIEIGAGTGFMTRRLVELFPDTFWTINDLVEESASYTAPYLNGKRAGYLWGDAETIGLPEEQGAIVSASTVQWFDDLPRFVGRAYRALEPEGYFALSTFGPDNFHEIKATAGEGLSYRTSADLLEMLSQTGFTIAENLEYIKHLYFDTPTDVLRHIKATGVNSLHNTRWTKGQLNDFEQRYKRLFTNRDPQHDGQVSLTYHPILIVARKE